MMTKEIINAINITLDAYSVIISIIIICSIILYKDIEKHVKWFGLTNLAAIVYGISDIFMWISEGTDAKWKFIALPVSSFVFFLSGIFIFICYLKYIINYYGTTEPIHKKYIYTCYGIAAAYIIMLICTPFTNWYYEILPENVYKRGKLFNATVLFEALLYLEAIFIIVKNHRKLTNIENIGFTSFIFVPFIMQIIQIMNYGIALNSLGLTISFFIIYLTMDSKLRNKIDKTTQSFSKNFAKTKDNVIELEQNTIRNLATLIENKENSESKHILRVNKYIRELAKLCKKEGYFQDTITDQYIDLLAISATFHDIGNMAVPYTVLRKPDKLDPQEHAKMERHTTEGAKMINNIFAIGVERALMKISIDLCKYHHEKWNGKGYPEHLCENDIPLCARLFNIVDSFDAMVTPRCYKKAISCEEAFKIIEQESGEQFDPTIVSVFLKYKDKFIEINEKFADYTYEGA